ncbi:hypothetical protein FRC01_008333 [Tulasnella sp. 417]|nr:hypothetical protein FRC01_008333 [Tulasnella sp. 417]
MELEELFVSLHLAIPYSMEKSIPQLGGSSSPEEWSQRGQQYFSKGLYSKAAVCFHNAKNHGWENISRAYNDRKTALELPQEHESRIDRFFKAAKAFERLALSPESPVSPTTSYRCFVVAAECYASAKDYPTAACAFSKGQKYTEAAHHYRLSGQFEEAVGVIRQHSVDQDVAQDIIYEAKLAYIKRGDMPSLRQAWDLCSSKNEFFEFLQNHGFDEQRITVHDNLGEYEQAGDILWAGGKHLPAVKRFRLVNSVSSRGKAIECFLEGLRAVISFANGYRKLPQVLSELFECGKDVELSKDEVDEIELLRDVAAGDSERLKEKIQHHRSSGNMLYALFAFDAFIWSIAPRSLQSASENEIVKILGQYQRFSALVKTVFQMRGILDKPAARYMFGISITKSNPLSQEETISVKYPSFAHTALKGSALGPTIPANSVASVPLPRLELADLICQALLTRLNQFISGVELLARKSRAFQLCASFLTTGHCDSKAQELCWKDHRPKTDSASTIIIFNSQLRLHVLMISLLNQFTGLGKDGARSRTGKLLAWFTRLFKLCYPPTNWCGNLSDIRPPLIPEYLQVMPTVRSCLRETFKCLRPSQNPTDFLDNILVTSFLAMAFDYLAAASYLDFKKQELDKKLPEWKRDEKKERDSSFAREYRLAYPESGQPLAETVLTWCTQKSTRSMEEMVSFLGIVLTGNTPLDIELAVTLIEEVCGQIIFNHKMCRADELHDLMAPRSWIMRALSKGPSLPPSDDSLATLVESLGEFIKILSSECHDDRCGLHIEGVSLKDDKSLTRRNHTIIRACICLALVGHNVAQVRDKVLFILNKMDECPFLATVSSDELNVSSHGWDRIFQALKLASSNLDDLLLVFREEGVAKDVSALEREFNPDQRSLVDQLSFSPKLSSPSTAIAVQENSFRRSAHPSPVLRILPGCSTEKIDQGSRSSYNAGIQNPDDVQHLTRSIPPSQPFFLLHQLSASRPIVSAFEEVIKLQIQMSEACADDRFLVFSLRGLLLHVVAYVARVDAGAAIEIEKYDKAVRVGGKSARDLIVQRSQRVSKLREIHNQAEQFIQDLSPLSDFHFDGTSNSQASLSGILEKVKTIPGLVESLRPFTTLPNGTLPTVIDPDSRVKPLLKYLATWK